MRAISSLNQFVCRRQLLVTILLLLTTVISIEARSEDIKPGRVVIRSSFKEEVRVPQIRSHTFEVVQPGQIREPYLPDFEFTADSLPDSFPQNLKFHWLTTLSPSLSRLFRGNRGRLENGILLFQQNKTGEAESDLLPLLSESSEFSEPATLYLAWIKLKEGLPEETFRLGSRLQQSKSTAMIQEGGYVQALALLSRNDHPAIVRTCEALKQQVGLEQFQPKLLYIYLVSLAQLGYWKEAWVLSSRVARLPVQHTRFYYKLMELSALVDYELKQYATSLEKFEAAKSYQGHPFYHNFINRRIAWLHYLMGDYLSSLQILDKIASLSLNEFRDELDYLRLACHTRLNDWGIVNRLLKQHPKTSIFYTYSAFQVRSFLKNPDDHQSLFTQVSSLKFDFPEMKFHVAILDGNLFFNKKDFPAAQRSYIRALSVDSSSPDYWKAHYNLALTQLKQKRFETSEKDFKRLLRTINNGYNNRIRYHLSYAQFQLREKEETLRTVRSVVASKFNDTERLELKLIEAGTLMRLGRYDQARVLFERQWTIQNHLESLEFLAKIYYDTKRFERVLELAQDSRARKHKPFVLYQIKSLLAMRRFNEAEKLAEKLDDDNNPIVELKLKVWAANQQNHKIISYINRLLRESNPPEIRRFYYLSLGDAYFNLEKYRESKSQFYRALGLSRDPALRSQIQYNIALSSYYYKDQTSFLKESKLVLSDRHVSNENRYNLTLLLAQHYRTEGDIRQMDRIYEKHYRSYSYNRANILLKRIRLWFGEQNYRKCMELGSKAPDKESNYQRRDRVILFGYCGNQARQPGKVIKAVKAESTSTSDTYRDDELMFVLAQSYSQAEEYSRSMILSKKLIKKPLNKKVRQETQLLISHNLLNLHHPDKALVELGDVNQYRVTGKYVKSLHLRSEIEFRLNRHNRAHRTLLRIYYLSDSTPASKQLALLRLAEGYFDAGALESARKHHQLINPDVVKHNPGGERRYQRLGKAIQKKLGQS